MCSDLHSINKMADFFPDIFQFIHSKYFPSLATDQTSGCMTRIWRLCRANLTLLSKKSKSVLKSNIKKLWYSWNWTSTFITGGENKRGEIRYHFYYNANVMGKQLKQRIVSKKIWLKDLGKIVRKFRKIVIFSILSRVLAFIFVLGEVENKVNCKSWC